MKKFKVNQINFRVDFVDNENEGGMLIYYHWLRHISEIKDSVIILMRDEFDLEYLTDYTINSTQKDDTRPAVMINFCDAEKYVMTKLSV